VPKALVNQEKMTMVCSMVKKGVVAAALGAGALYLAFGTLAPSYVRTAFHKGRHAVKSTVPPQFDIDRARDEIASLEPAIRDNIELLARSEVDVEYLEREIATVENNLAAEKKEIVAMRESLDTGDFRLAGRVSYTADEIKGDLARRLDHYRNVTRTLEEKQATLKIKQKAVTAAHQQLKNMAAQKKALLAKLDGIEARLKMIEATRATNDYNFDDSALARAKRTVAELDKRLDEMARFAELEGRFSEAGTTVIVEPGRDVVKEIDAEFGAPEGDSTLKTTDKSL
jgi:chromosome segregation ATPase